MRFWNLRKNQKRNREKSQRSRSKLKERRKIYWEGGIEQLIERFIPYIIPLDYMCFCLEGKIQNEI